MIFTEKKANGCLVMPSGHARDIPSSFGVLHPSGTRCDRKPHPRYDDKGKLIPHHACGEHWEVKW